MVEKTYQEAFGWLDKLHIIEDNRLLAHPFYHIQMEQHGHPLKISGLHVFGSKVPTY